jgi:hypothetical protein
MWQREYSLRPLITDKHVSIDSLLVQSHIENIDEHFIVVGQSTSSACCCEATNTSQACRRPSSNENLLLQTSGAVISSMNLSWKSWLTDVSANFGIYPQLLLIEALAWGKITWDSPRDITLKKWTAYRTRKYSILITDQSIQAVIFACLDIMRAPRVVGSSCDHLFKLTFKIYYHLQSTRTRYAAQ